MTFRLRRSRCRSGLTRGAFANSTIAAEKFTAQKPAKMISGRARLPALDYSEYHIHKNETDDHPAKNFYVACHHGASFPIKFNVRRSTPGRDKRVRVSLRIASTYPVDGLTSCYRQINFPLSRQAERSTGLREVVDRAASQRRGLDCCLTRPAQIGLGTLGVAQTA